jgi:hypothetical protein
MAFQPFDRLPVVEWAGWWTQTLDRWHRGTVAAPDRPLRLRVLDEVCAVCTPGFMTFAEDMSYNHGPMLSKALYDEFMAPCYRRIVPLLRARGILPLVDSDGDIAEPAGWFEEVGLGGVLPLERQAGVDIGVLRRRYPRLCFVGHYDKMHMDQGETAARRVRAPRPGGLAGRLCHQLRSSDAAGRRLRRVSALPAAVPRIRRAGGTPVGRRCGGLSGETKRRRGGQQSP